MRKKFRTPQEKKALSYVLDRRNSYGENDKASRKSIPLRKALVNRAYRKRVNEILGNGKGNIDIEIAENLESNAKEIKRIDWKKSRDMPLGQYVERKLSRRITHAGNGKTAGKRAREFVASLNFSVTKLTDDQWVAEIPDFGNLKGTGLTREEAINSCKCLASIVFLESIGAVQIMRHSGGYLAISIN